MDRQHETGWNGGSQSAIKKPRPADASLTEVIEFSVVPCSQIQFAAALPCGCSYTAALLPEEAFFDFRINLAEPLLCALYSVPVALGFSL